MPQMIVIIITTSNICIIGGPFPRYRQATQVALCRFKARQGATFCG
jgi:hypothetical protein